MLALPLNDCPPPATRRRPADSLIIAALPAGVALRHADGRITPCNAAAQALVSAGGDRLDAVLGAGTPETATVVLESGARLRIEQRALPESADQLLLFTDVTREHRLDEALSRHQRLASLGELAATLAHQVRTPLAAALLYLDNARLPALDPARQAELLDQATTCLRDLEQLVAGLLGFARGAGREDRPTPLPDVLDGVATAAAPLCRPTQRLEIDASAAGLAVAVGRESLVAALLNLVQNALQATGPGAIVRITATATGDTVELAVSDNGPGIPPALRARVLEPFFTTRSGGTGLGLAVVQSLVTAAGGTVAIDQNEPRGTRVTLRLPRVAPPGDRP
jgi:two-component system sensor histidine kinase FlrB